MAEADERRGRPPSPFSDGSGFCSICLYRTRLWVPAEGPSPAAWLCEDHDDHRPRRGDGSLGRVPLPDVRPRPPYVPGLATESAAAADEAHRSRAVARVRAMSRDLTRRPTEFVGRESHTVLMGGPLVDVAHDTSAPEELRAWALRVLALMRDLPTRRRLQEQHLTAAELEAADHSWDGEG